MHTAREVRVYGLVQGVGFRPFVHRLAKKHRLLGWAANTRGFVHMKLQGTESDLEAFLEALSAQPPPLARIERIETEASGTEEFEGFHIRESRSNEAAPTRIAPDIAVCGECLEDIFGGGRRRHYPFSNCTNCGPRFSIVRELPYDRSATTMDLFPMCGECRREYEEIENRRYHAQPNACPRCGPHYTLICAGGAGVSGDKADGPEGRAEEAGVGTGAPGSRIDDIDEILEKTARIIESGGIVAIKGVGGFHLACDAADEQAVRRLRAQKRRDGKPFAIMCRSADALEGLVIGEEERRLLHDPGRPIVLLREEDTRHSEGAGCGNDGEPPKVAPSVSRGLHTLGVMLPYAPIQHLLFSRLQTDALVMTSGNPSEVPLIHTNEEAERKLSDIADASLLYNREIHNRCDDSVVMAAAGQMRAIRRSRGMVPSPIALPFPVEGIVAGGAELKSCCAVGKEEAAILSQHIGDLKNYETRLFYRETLDRFLELFHVEPCSAVCDLHPDYASTREMRALGLPVTEVQHHHAHIASVLAERGIEGPVIGVAFDGTGYGDDGAVWGGEFLLCDLCGYERVSHLGYVPLPGGDRAAEEPWRMALSHLLHSYPADSALRLAGSLCGIDAGRLDFISRAISTGTAAPSTSSAGRLFDAVSALLGITQVSSFEAEASMRLETLAWRRADERVRAGGSTSSRARGTEEELLRVPVYSFSPGETVETAAMIREIVEDIQRGTAPAEIALRFHRSVAEIIVSVANRIRDGRKTWAAGNASTECEEPAAEKDSPAAGNGRKRGRLDTLVLSGGVFQNRLLLEMAFRLLEREGFRVFANREVPANDGGIALGQIAVAGARAAGERLRDRRAMDSRELGEGERKHRRGGVYVSGHSG